MAKKKLPKNIQSHQIALYEGMLEGFEHPQYRIDIDGEYLGAFLDRQSGKEKYHQKLLPALGLFDAKEQQQVLTLAGMLNVQFPVLVCSDDMDLSCIVVAVTVEAIDDYIVWCHFAYGMTGETAISVPDLYFPKRHYQIFVKQFQDAAKAHLETR